MFGIFPEFPPEHILQLSNVASPPQSLLQSSSSIEPHVLSQPDGAELKHPHPKSFKFWPSQIPH